MSLSLFPSAVRGLGYTVTKSPEDSVLKQRSPSFAETRIIQSQNPIYHWSLLYDFLIDNPRKPNSAFAYTDLQTMLGFVKARRNSYDDFLFLDPDDNFFGPGVVTQSWLPAYPYMLGTIIIVGGNAWQLTTAPAGAKSGYIQPAFVSSPQADGLLSWTQLGAAVGGTAWPNPQAQLQLVTDGTNWYSPLQINTGGQFYEDVTDLASSLLVYANGVFTSAYTLQYGGLSISGFSSAGLYLNWGTSAPTAPVTAQFNYYYKVRFEDDTQDFEKWANQWWAIGGPEGSKGKGELKLVTSRVPLLSTGGTAIPILPAPPLSACAGATQMVELYPTTISLGSYPGISVAQGQAGPQAWATLNLSVVGLGSPKANATFGGYSLPPSVPAGAVKCVYSYVGAGSNSLQGVGWSYGVSGGTGVVGSSGANSFHDPFQSLYFPRIDNGTNGPTFPFSTVQQTTILSASLPGTLSPPYVAYFVPRLIVFY